MKVKAGASGAPQFERPAKRIEEIRIRYNRKALARALMSPETWSVPDAEFDALREALIEEQVKKLQALYDFYGIKPRLQGGLLGRDPFSHQSMMTDLAWALARHLVKNFDSFQPPKGPGRKAGRKLPYGADLVSAVDEMCARSKLTVRAACKNLAKKKPWSDAAPGTLEPRYYDAKKDIAFREAMTAKAEEAILAKAENDRQLRATYADVLGGKGKKKTLGLLGSIVDAGATDGE